MYAVDHLRHVLAIIHVSGLRIEYLKEETVISHSLLLQALPLFISSVLQMYT